MQLDEQLGTDQILRMLELAEQPIKVAELVDIMICEFGASGVNAADVKGTLGILCRTPFRLFISQTEH